MISGGVSEGAFDLVEEVLARFDVGLLFTKVAIKPGRAPGLRPPRGQAGLRPAREPGVGAGDVRRLRARRRSCACRERGWSRGRRWRSSCWSAMTQPLRPPEPPARRASACEDGRLVAARVPTAGSADVVAHAARQRASSSWTPRALQAAAGEKAPALLLGNFLERDGSRLKRDAEPRRRRGRGAHGGRLRQGGDRARGGGPRPHRDRAPRPCASCARASFPRARWPRWRGSRG